MGRDNGLNVHSNQEQKDYLTELLQDKNNSLWSSVLYGITASDDQIVTARCRRSAMWAASLTGLGTASALVWSGALAFYLGVRMSADILTPALSRSLQAV